MDKQKAYDIIYLLAHGHSHRRLSEIFTEDKELSGNQLEGMDLVTEACSVLGVSKEVVYSLQDQCLDLQSDLSKVLDNHLERQFKIIFGVEAPTFREIIDREIKNN